MEIFRDNYEEEIVGKKNEKVRGVGEWFEEVCDLNACFGNHSQWAVNFWIYKEFFYLLIWDENQENFT